MNVVKSEIDTICRGCLCVDRVLMPLNKNVDLFFIFLGNELSISEDSKYYNILLCWECIALLKKAEVFRKRIQKAHKYFERLLSSPASIEGLTSLNSFQKDDYDLICVENDQFEPKVKPESLKYEVGLQIETEIVNSDDYHIKEEAYDDNSLDYEERHDPKAEASDNCLKKAKKKARNYKIQALGKRIKTTAVKYTAEERERYIETVNYDLNYILAMEKDEKKPSRIKNMEHRCNLYVTKLLDSKKRDIGKRLKPDGMSCSECDTVVADQAAMKAHWEEHPVSLFKCYFCGWLSKSRSNVNYHVQQRHSMIYNCTLCNIEFRALPEYYKHYRALHRTFVCDYCGKRFQQKSGIERHIRRKHLPLKCEICKRVFKKVAFLNNHMAVCHPDAKWRTVKRELTYCVECDMHFATEYLYKRHLRTAIAHRPKPKIKHNHLPAVCVICNFTFKRKSYLAEHNALMHPEKKETKKKIVKELAYCVECDMQFASEYFYRRHLRYAVAHKRRVRLKVPCPECGKIFSRKSYMDNHYKLIHVRKSQHYCELCDKHFINGYAIRTHKKFVHEKYEKPKNKICDICGRGFHTNRVLINHKRTHTGERPYKCTYCPAAFAQNVARKTHEKTQHKNLLTELKGFST